MNGLILVGFAPQSIMARRGFPLGVEYVGANSDDVFTRAILLKNTPSSPKGRKGRKTMRSNGSPRGLPSAIGARTSAQPSLMAVRGSGASLAARDTCPSLHPPP